jgi:hypothetical protein
VNSCLFRDVKEVHSGNMIAYKPWLHTARATWWSGCGEWRYSKWTKADPLSNRPSSGGAKSSTPSQRGVFETVVLSSPSHECRFQGCRHIHLPLRFLLGRHRTYHQADDLSIWSEEHGEVLCFYQPESHAYCTPSLDTNSKCTLCHPRAAAGATRRDCLYNETDHCPDLRKESQAASRGGVEKRMVR